MMITIVETEDAKHFFITVIEQSDTIGKYAIITETIEDLHYAA